jgi:uncharacterized membrane protein YbhN (UPF0104 family)
MYPARTRALVAVGILIVLGSLVVPPLFFGIHLHALGLLEAVAGSLLLVASSALALNGSRPVALPARRAVKTVLATTAANAVTPAGVGGALLTMRVHRRTGLTAEQALAATAMRSLAGALVATATTAVLASTIGMPGLPSDAPYLLLGVVGAALGVVVAVPRWRARLVALLRAVGDLLLRPRCCAMLIVGCLGVTVGQLLTLQGAVGAVGGHLGWETLLVTLMGSAAARSALPSPGGVGPIEAALVGGLTAVGLGFGAAAAAVAVYRTAGHWLPVMGGMVSARVLRRLELV